AAWAWAALKPKVIGVAAKIHRVLVVLALFPARADLAAPPSWGVVIARSARAGSVGPGKATCLAPRGVCRRTAAAALPQPRCTQLTRWHDAVGLCPSLRRKPRAARHVVADP